MRYIPNSPEERAEMLQHIGVRSAEELFESVPRDLRLAQQLNTPDALSEMELLARFDELARRNPAASRPNFLGAGAYSHYIPTTVDHILSRSEFFTSYTPYQPEISQGTLQAIFEFQTLVCQLTGMEVANASMYDGSTALAEAVLMAERLTRRSKVIACGAIHPEYLEVVSTYVQHAGIRLERTGFESDTGQVSMEAVKESIDDHTAALVVQTPNFFGCIEHVSALSQEAHSKGALLIVVITEVISLGLLKPPGACGADIVVAEGQSFGVPLSFGGPYVGLFATLEKYARQIPGRLVGEAFDKQGRRGFVLTLATREQHIRREKATSNICTNQGLIALAATVYMETMGRKGLQEIAYQNIQKAAYAASQISRIKGYSILYNAPRFNEFVVQGPVNAAKLISYLASECNVSGGLPLTRYFPDRSNDFLVCVTETNSKADINNLVNGLTSALSKLQT